MSFLFVCDRNGLSSPVFVTQETNQQHMVETEQGCAGGQGVGAIDR